MTLLSRTLGNNNYIAAGWLVDRGVDVNAVVDRQSLLAQAVDSGKHAAIR